MVIGLAGNTIRSWNVQSIGVGRVATSCRLRMWLFSTIVSLPVAS